MYAMYVCECMPVCMYAWVHVRMHTCIDGCRHSCMYVLYILYMEAICKVCNVYVTDVCVFVYIYVYLHVLCIMYM